MLYCAQQCTLSTSEQFSADQRTITYSFAPRPMAHSKVNGVLGSRHETAVFREVNVPMEIEEVTVSSPVRRGSDSYGLRASHSMHFFNGSYPGKLPMVLGHESAGIVEQVGSDVHYVKPGIM